MIIHCDEHVGQCDNGITVEEITNCHGQHFFKATTTITHLFGYEVCSTPTVGIGPTREIAIDRLKKELNEFNDSLWYQFPKENKNTH